jgi:positive regulator of sigma E activity
MLQVLGRWWYPAVILVPAFVAVVYFSGTLGMALWLRLILIALWLALATVVVRRYSRRSSPS